MLRLVTFLFFGFVAFSVRAEVLQETKEAQLAVGFGFHLCGRAEVLPPLETAFLCPGLQARLENFIVALKPEKTNNPESKLWSGRIAGTVRSLEGIDFSYELLVSSAIINAKEYSFISGRITNSRTGAPAYFRVTVQGRFDEMNGSYHFSSPIELKAKTGELMDLSAVLAISRKY